MQLLEISLVESLSAGRCQILPYSKIKKVMLKLVNALYLIMSLGLGVKTFYWERPSPSIRPWLQVSSFFGTLVTLQRKLLAFTVLIEIFLRCHLFRNAQKVFFIQVHMNWKFEKNQNQLLPF